MKKIGILGGIAWQSTVDYYAGLCRRSQDLYRLQNGQGIAPMPEIVIESLDLAKAFSLFGDESDRSWRAFDDYHRAALLRLENAGADFAVIASNTPHNRFDSITANLRLPVLDMFEATARAAAAANPCDVLILGTAVTMRSSRLGEQFAKYGVRSAAPDQESIRSRNVSLIHQLQRDEIQGAADMLHEIVGLAGNPQSLVCLACTELPLAFPERPSTPIFEDRGRFFLDTTQAHINAAFLQWASTSGRLEEDNQDRYARA